MISYFGLDALPNQHLNSSTVLLTSECFWCLFLPDLCRNVSNSVNTSLCSSNISWRHSVIFFPPSGEERTAFASSTQTSSSYIMNGFLYSRRIGWGSGGREMGPNLSLFLTQNNVYYNRCESQKFELGVMVPDIFIIKKSVASSPGQFPAFQCGNGLGMRLKKKCTYSCSFLCHKL